MIRAAAAHISQICTPLLSSRCDSRRARRHGSAVVPLALSSFDHSPPFCWARTLPPGTQFIESIRCLWDTCKSNESLQSSSDSPFVLFIRSSHRARFEKSFVIWKSIKKKKKSKTKKDEAVKREEGGRFWKYLHRTSAFKKMFFRRYSDSRLLDHLTTRRLWLELIK